MTNYFGASGHSERPLQQYGAAFPLTAQKAKSGMRFNIGAVCLALFVPWLLFCAMYSAMSFSMHYKEKLLCYLIVGLALLFVIFLVRKAFVTVTSGQADPQNDSSWFVFLAFACALAWVLGVCLGDLNYFYNMEPYYDTSNLNNYPAVDPSKMPGQQIMDAGQISFVPGTRLDMQRTMSFHNEDEYCVVPIINAKSQPTYDFWAVGMNCCSGTSNEFACGEFSNPSAKSGLRVMREDQREFYRLAVKQAESAYSIKANHPLFFHWMEDPGLELAAYMDEGFKYFLFGVYAFFAFLLFLVIVALVLFSKH